MFRSLLVLSCCLALASCSTPTPYQPENSDGGFADFALNKNTYTITFSGNSSTSEKTVTNYLLRRCAELSLQKGYPFFVKLEGNTSKDTSLVQTPTIINKHDSDDEDSKDSYTVVSPGSTYALDSYTSKMTIKMLENNTQHPDAYDARMILSNFRKAKA